MGLEFFKQYGGRRLDVRDGQSIESGMATEHLREELAVYQNMLTTGKRPNGVDITAQDRRDITRQADRFASELARRGKAGR